MQKELLKEAETVEEAVRLAAEELGVPQEDLTVEVLQEQQKKACKYLVSASKETAGVNLCPTVSCVTCS